MSLSMAPIPARTWPEMARELIAILAADATHDRPGEPPARTRAMVLAALTQAIAEQEVHAEYRQPRWRSVQRALDALNASPGETWTLPGLAGYAGVSTRRLQEGFRAQVGVPPMAYARLLRLEKAREELLTGAMNVADCAQKWGFAHLGRFAAEYRKHFGEPPSRTLARTQGRERIAALMPAAPRSPNECRGEASRKTG